MRIYTSFDQIDRDLEIYKLEAEIEKEKMKQNYFILKETVSPLNITAAVISLITKKTLYSQVLRKILPFVK